jgi:uncharacterized protein CbrC (UPF0167 family)
MQFDYFHALESDMEGLAAEPGPCRYCNQRLPCIVSETSDGETTYACLACLRDGRWTARHDTELGWTEGDGFQRIVNPEDVWKGKPLRTVHEAPPAAFCPQAIQSLCRTPRFKTIQHYVWLVHCNDFMAYIGRWEPDDFVRNAPDGDARAFCESMLWDWQSDTWDQYAGQNETPESWYGGWFHVFRCRHCQKHRGYLECS